MTHARRHRPTTPTHRSDGAREGRRGIALLMVLIGVGVAATVSVTVLATRNTSAAVGRNATSQVQAEWTARSAANWTLAALQTAMRVSDHPSGNLLADFDMYGAEVDVRVTLPDGSPVTEEATDLLLTVTAACNGVAFTVQERVTRAPEPDIDSAVDGALGEFALYAGSQLSSDATIIMAPWKHSASNASGEAFKIAAGFTDSSDLRVSPLADTLNAELFVEEHAAADLEADISTLTGAGFVTGGGVIPLTLPRMFPAIPSEFTSGLTSVPVYTGGDLEGGNQYPEVAVPAHSEITVAPESGNEHIVVDELYLNNSAELKVDGHVIMGVRGDVVIEGYSEICMTDSDSSLTLFVRGSVYVDEATLGGEDHLLLPYLGSPQDIDLSLVDPARLTIYMVPDGGDFSEVVITNQSFLAANVHAPESDVYAGEGSVLIGRIMGDTITLRRNVSVLYDTRLDAGMGFSELDGPLYTDEGDPIDGLVSALSSYATSNGFDGLASYVHSVLPDFGLPDLADTPEGDPTPREASRVDAKMLLRAVAAMEKDETRIAEAKARVVSPVDTVKDASASALDRLESAMNTKSR